MGALDCAASDRSAGVLHKSVVNEQHWPGASTPGRWQFTRQVNRDEAPCSPPSADLSMEPPRAGSSHPTPTAMRTSHVLSSTLLFALASACGEAPSELQFGAVAQPIVNGDDSDAS